MNAISCAGSVDNLILLDPEKYKSLVYNVVSDFIINGQCKWKRGELEFEALMRMLDNLVSPPTEICTSDTKLSGSKRTHMSL